MRCEIDIFQQAKEVMAYSGRSFFRKGHYEDCLEHSDLKYGLVQLGSGGNKVGFFGLCLPKACPDSLIAGSLNSGLKALNMSMEVTSIDSHTEDYKLPLTWVSYLTILWFVLAVVLVAVSALRRRPTQKCNKWLACFDPMNNVKQLVTVRQKDDLRVWDGVRALAMMWVIIGHTFQFSTDVSSNLLTMQHVFTQPFILIIQAGLLSVDVFLCLGGFFLAFVLLRNTVNVKTCLLAPIQRALRIWPAYLFCMMFFFALLLRLGSGVLWSRGHVITDQCDSMWRQLLFVSNFIDQGRKSCLPWGWYLQVDFQLFLVGLLLIWVYSYKKLAFNCLASLLSLASTVFIFAYTIKYDSKMPADFKAKGGTYFNDVYIQPYGRCVPYLMGLILGVLFMEYRAQTKLCSNQDTFLGKLRQLYFQRNRVRVFLEWLGVALMAFVTFLPRPVQMGAVWPQWVHSLYLTLSKPIFIFGMFLVVLPSVLGVKHSFFRPILSSKVLGLIAKISFSTYLVHFFLLYHFLFSRNYDSYYHIEDVFVIYLGLLPLCLICGFSLCLLVELPFGNMLRIAMQKKKKPAKIQGDSLVTSQSIVVEEIILKK